MKPDREENTVPYVYCLRVSAELMEAVGEAADKERLPMNEYIARVLADRLDKPELAVIPRKPFMSRRKRAKAK